MLCGRWAWLLCCPQDQPSTWDDPWRLHRAVQAHHFRTIVLSDSPITQSLAGNLVWSNRVGPAVALCLFFITG